MDENKQEGEEKDKYSSQFEDLLGKNQKISKQERDFIDRQKEAKRIADEQASQENEARFEEHAQKKEQEFDDLLKGKQSNDDKNLQQIFAEFYSRAKETDFKKPLGDKLNSARSSIGSMGSKLEQRRQSMKNNVKDKVGSGFDGDQVKTEEKAADATKDASTAAKEEKGEHKEEKVDTTKDTIKEEAKPEQASQKQEEKVEQAKTEYKEQAKEETKEQVKEPKKSFKERLHMSGANLNSKLGVKYPSVHAKANNAASYFSEVWQETFPQNKDKAKVKLDQRKERARLAREIEAKMDAMTPEELDAYMQAIPEWKRGALQVQENQEIEEEEVQSIFKRARAKAANKIKNTAFAKDLYEREGEKIDYYQKEYSQFKNDARDQIDASHNPMVRGLAHAHDKARAETGTAKAIKAMQRYDPEFDFASMHFEVEEIFREFYCNYLDGNLDYIRKLTAGEAVIVQALIELRRKEGWEFKYPEVLDCSVPDFIGAKVVEGQPCFTFTVDVQEIDAKIVSETGEPYVPVYVEEESEELQEQEPAEEAKAEKDGKGESQEGEEQQQQQKSQKAKKSRFEKLKKKLAGDANDPKIPRIVKSTYSMTLSRHTEPDIELAGHYWEFTEFQKINELKQIA